MADYRLESTGDDVSDNANLRLIMELSGGVIHDETGHLIAELLRSDYRLTPTLRSILADAFEGTAEHIRKIEMKRKKPGPKPVEPPAFAAMKKGLAYLRWGQFISQHPDYGLKVENAIQDACNEFDIQRSEAYEGLRYWRSFQAIA